MRVPARALARLAAGALLLTAACQRTTGTLSDEQLQRFEREGIVRRAVDVPFRRTRGIGTADGGWEELTASIIVTTASVAIHRGSTFALEITPRSTGSYELSRDHDRLSLRGGSGKSVVSWSFRPAADATGWAADIRTVIRGTVGARRRDRDGAPPAS